MPKKRIVLLIVTALVVLFIFGQSILPQSVSADESGWVLNKLINPLLNLFGLKPMTHHTVRKLAHVLEFTVLAFLLVPLWNSIPKACFTGFTVAFLDESLQLLTARGAQLQDVWIDLLGVAVGTLLAWLLRLLVRRRPSS